MKGSKWYAERRMVSDRIELHCLHEDERGRHYVEFGEGTITQLDDQVGAYRGSPSLALSEDEAQQIMNELWLVGLRPKDGAGALAHVESLQSHLADLRAVAFKGLGIEQ